MKTNIRLLLLLIISLTPAISLYSMANSPSLSSFKFNGASVLPYTRWKAKMAGGKAYFLLARESRGVDAGTFDAFGGAKDPNEAHPVVTAAREFAEETIGLLGSAKIIKKYIDIDTGNTHSIIANIKKEMATYITKFDPKILESFVSSFYQKLSTAQHANQTEKDQLAWVSWQNLETIIGTAPRDAQGRLINPIEVWANVIDMQGKKLAQKIQLRPCFVSSLQSFFAGQQADVLGKNPKIKFYNK